MSAPLTPDSIRIIREGLGLTQREAGELLGGGPNAFAKYETGQTTPSAAFANLLKLLEANPRALGILHPERAGHAPSARPLPFEVTSQHLAVISKQTFPQFARSLLYAEALSHGVPPDGIHVSDKIDVPDGGEDGRISWDGGLEQTSFLPGRLCQFQLKTGKIEPATAGREVLTKAGKVKKMVQSALDRGGYYIVLSTNSYTQQQIEKRETRIREALRDTGLEIDDAQVSFRDASQLAAWTNTHPAVATWLLEKIMPGLLGPFRSWHHWAGRFEHVASPWVDDERLGELRRFLRDWIAIGLPRSMARVVGLTGVGKSRLVLEALRSIVAGDSKQSIFGSLVLYAVEGEASSETLKSTVQQLADSKVRAVVVVDQCAPETRRVLISMAMREASQLSLVTIEDEVPSGTPDDSTYQVHEASSAVIESLVDRVAPGLQGSDQRRLVRFSRGFPGLAIRIAQAWTAATPLAHATEDNLVDAYVLGGDSPEPALLLKSAALLATFGLIGIEPDADAQLENIASLGRNLSPDDLHVALVRLTEKGIARQQGRYVSIEPGPIAMRLTERQWKEWRKNTWDKVLTDNSASTSFAGDLNLNVLASKQLKLLNTVAVSQKVVEHICRYGGPFDGLHGILAREHAEVLSHLAEIDTGAVAGLLERLLANVNDLADIIGDTRKHLVWAVAKLAFDADTFEDGARLLLQLAVAESENGADHAARWFADLFPLILGRTEADGTQRLELVDALSKTDDPTELQLVIKALTQGLELDYFTRDVGPEVHGTRPELNSWEPKTEEEARTYVRGCATRLIDFATRSDATGALARDSLGPELASLVRHGFIDIVERAVEEAGTAVEYWPEARNRLGFYLSRHSSDASKEELDRVQALIDELKPKSLKARMQSLVTGVPFEYSGISDHNYEEQHRRRVEAVRVLAAEAVKQPETLQELLPRLIRGRQVMVREFGQALAESTDSWDNWLEPIIQAIEETEEAERNYDLLAGFVRGIADEQPAVVEDLKQRIAKCPLLTPVLPMLCLIDGFTAPDIALMVAALQNGLLSPKWLTWEIVGPDLRNAPPKVMSPLLDAMLHHSGEGFAVALNLLGYYVYPDRNRLEAFRLQIRAIAENALRWPWRNLSDAHMVNMVSEHFKDIISWMLDQGPDDSDASATALALSKAAVNSTDYNRIYRVNSVLPILLSRFPGVVWPLIGSAIVGNDLRQRFLCQAMLGEQPGSSRGRKPGDGEICAPILQLPEDALFAWCHAHPERAPAFAARTVPFLASNDDGKASLSMHPVMIRLIEEFGDREDVTNAIVSTLLTKGRFVPEEDWWTTYHRLVTKRLSHSNPKVRRWAKVTLRELGRLIEHARVRDAEAAARVEG